MGPSIPNIWKFHKLALFLCHLFIDAKFRTTHIIFDPNIFDVQILIEIKSVCPEPIPWLLTDISQPSKQPFVKHQDIEMMLQLIFFDPSHLRQQMYDYRRYLIYYRFFVFLSRRQNLEEYSLIRRFFPSINSNTMILYYDVKRDWVDVSWIPINDLETEPRRPLRMNLDAKESANAIQRTHTKGHLNMYDKTFGVYDRERSIAINVVAISQGGKRHTWSMEYMALARYYASLLPTSYVNATMATLEDKSSINLKFLHRPGFGKLGQSEELVRANRRIS